MTTRRAVEFVITCALTHLPRASGSVGTLRAAVKCPPGELRGLYLARSNDLVCRNLMCGKVGTPCVCRIGRWLSQHRPLLASCEQLSLRGNALHVLPDEVWSLPRLTHLDLSDNDLAVLPEEIGRLASLEVLYVNANQLGELPQSLCSLPRLRYVNVSANRIPGEDLKAWAQALGPTGTVSASTDDLPAQQS